jgi:hypothetical protein
MENVRSRNSGIGGRGFNDRQKESEIGKKAT